MINPKRFILKPVSASWADSHLGLISLSGQTGDAYTNTVTAELEEAGIGPKKSAKPKPTGVRLPCSIISSHR